MPPKSRMPSSVSSRMRVGGDELAVVGDEDQGALDISSARFSDSMDSMSRWLVGSSMMRMLGFLHHQLAEQHAALFATESTFDRFLMSSWENSRRPEERTACSSSFPCFHCAIQSNR